MPLTLDCNQKNIKIFSVKMESWLAVCHLIARQGQNSGLSNLTASVAARTVFEPDPVGIFCAYPHLTISISYWMWLQV